MVRERDIQRAQEIRVHGKQTQAEAEQQPDVKKAPGSTAAFQPFSPKRSREHRQADESEHVPIGRGLVVE
jgi:hypothetical protein